MSYLKIWVHLVFSTRYRQHLLKKDAIPVICEHIMSQCKAKGIYLQSINGTTNHIHCLFSLGKEQTVAQVVQQIKGESSFWINRHRLSTGKFTWQDDYFGISVSTSSLERVIAYIQNQEEHHRSVTFQDEMEQFLKKNGFSHIRE